MSVDLLCLTIQINLEKGRDGYWWTAMFEGGHEIKLDSIDTTRYMHEFGQEERACVQKLMFDQQQKRLGLPTSDELVSIWASTALINRVNLVIQYYYL